MTRRAAASLALLFVLLLPCCAIAAKDPVTMTVLCLPDSFVTVRSSAGLRGGSIGRLYLGDSVQVDSVKRDSSGRNWWHCTGLACESEAGYVCMDYLTDGDCTLYGQHGTPAAVTANGRVAARKSVGGERKSWLKPGASVTVYAVCGDWAVTNRGYVRREYLSIQEVDEP